MSRRRKERLAGDLAVFMGQYGRKSHAGHEPNDRRYDHDFEKAVKRMDPLELDELLRGEYGSDDPDADASD